MPSGKRTRGSDAAEARKALLVLSDLPAGWTVSPSPNGGGSSFTGAPGLASCIGVPAQIVGALPPEINSGQMSDKSGTVQVQQSISIFPSARFAPSPKGTTALDVDTALTDEGASVPSREELVFFVRGQFGDSLELMSTGSSATPSSLVRHLISVAQSRL
ncbi:MAG: hypothetical protein ACLQU9_11675 [Acidimicrobiales bacterium]